MVHRTQLPTVAPVRKTTTDPKRREDLVTRRESVDPALLRATREAEARRSVDHTWAVVRFVGAGFLLGALAVHAIASVRMARRIDVLNARLEQVTQEQERWRASPAPGLVFPALDVEAR